MAVVGKINSVQSVVASIKYARDGRDKDNGEEKCVGSTGYGIDPDYAEWQIRATARAYGKEKGVQGYSMVTSFKEGEISPQEALEVTQEAWLRTTREMNGDFPCAFYVHGNTNHIHVHAVAGAIDPQTGVKLHQKKMWELLADKTNEVCREHNLSVIAEKTEKRQDRVEFHLNQRGTYSWKTDLKERIEKAMTPALQNVKDFKANLQQLGVTLHDRMRQGEPIFLYEFLGKDHKNHKIKDFKLGGTAYQRQPILEKIKDKSNIKASDIDQANDLSSFFRSFSASVEKERARKRERLREERLSQPRWTDRDRGGPSL